MAEIEQEGLTFVERLDLQAQQDARAAEKLRADTARELAERKSERTEVRAQAAVWAVAIIALACVALGITLAIYKATTGPEEPDKEQEREQLCYEHGGGWVPSAMLEDPNGEDKGLCVYPGKAAIGDAPAG